MTISEIQNNVNNLISSWQKFQKSTQDKMSELDQKYITDSILTEKLEMIDNEFSEYKDRLDKLEVLSNRININDKNQESFEYKSLKEYIHKGYAHDLQQKSITHSDYAYFVPREISMQIDKNLAKNSIMRQLCSIEKISSDSLECFITNNKDTFVGWRGEEEDIQKDTQAPKINKKIIYLYELYAQPQITKKLLDDSLLDIGNWLINYLVDAFSRKENEAFISGDGQQKPSGILSSFSANNNEDKVQCITSNKLDSETIIKLYYSLDEYFAAKATFIMHRSVVQEIRSLKSASGQYIWQPGLSTNHPETLMGIPIYQTADMPLITSELPIIAIADFKSAYKIVESQDIKILRDPFTNKSCVTFYTTKRVGGSIVNNNAIKLLKIESTKQA
ncbi:phage major capsid protein [Neoehrlichia mikurensis]|uniref:Phage major capsid protein n=1 Tax=Neoehrlichia mikurensis TaxID=89586 RepID=A0A9Q9BWI4_9RICK|nr:phage major capsid protein [Neoehrlichia mikurensis]QXK92100.1 phage major capsid protein [Neoehrlichia mikurensis]QXK92557.1 phage major capsid protein [Neoehrlichia mikurensis]QXK93793.1 phage major capsid protein [Neoehrlichia mikurensis]UTO55231.1 phage major capsid protein [Neoehrlichia mikurensis]UTO56151.1 phage major capsid protein [Neoehrlichia mikurensis]